MPFLQHGYRLLTFISLDLAVGVASFTTWLQTDGRTDYGRTNIPSYTDAIDASENDHFPTDFAVFTKALRTYGPKDPRTDISDILSIKSDWRIFSSTESDF